MKPIIPPVDRELIEKELSEDKKLRKTNNGNNILYVVTHHDSPNIMTEIGRLREMSFRIAGGGTGKEQAIFLRALREVLSPIDNPRYLLARRKIWRILREDYFAVPDVVARKKEFAEMFTKRWKRLVGPVELVYTRTSEGRRLLLRARNHSLSGAFQKSVERVSCWK